MAETVTKVTAVSVEVEDKPGVAAKMTAKLRDANINLKALSCWPKGDGRAEVMCIPEDLAALRVMAAEEGVETSEKALVWVEGADRLGALCDCTEKLGVESINIVSCHALGVGSSYAAIFSFEGEEMVDQVIELLGS